MRQIDARNAEYNDAPQLPASDEQLQVLVSQSLDVPDDVLLDWANTPYKPLAGHVTFFETNQRTARETVSLAAGQCVGYHESFAAGNGTYLLPKRVGW